MTARDVERAKSDGKREPDGQVELGFLPPEKLPKVNDPVHVDLSAVIRVGESLFLSCDETAGVERLTREGGAWAKHDHFSLGDMVDLPDGPEGEMDIEGLDVDDGWLWVTGSQSLKRDKPKDHAPAEALERMEGIDGDPNRQFLGRVPLIETGEGWKPVRRDGDRRAQHLKFRKGGKLRKWLRGDAHLEMFLDIPSKENGLDIEGIAARGDRVWLGLRGPVLRGYAVILEMEMKETGKREIKPRRIDGKRRYRKHLLPTAGQGIRDLAVHGRDLLMLVGTAMDDAGPASVLRWKGALDVTESGVRPEEEISVAVDLPYRGQIDNPEGLAHWEKDTWIVVHDSPHEDRVRHDPPQLIADLWRMK